MNDNRLYIMKDFTYCILCKHLHNKALCNASRMVYSSYCFMVSGNRVPPGNSRIVLLRILLNTLSTVKMKGIVKCS